MLTQKKGKRKVAESGVEKIKVKTTTGLDITSCRIGLKCCRGRNFYSTGQLRGEDTRGQHR